MRVKIVPVKRVRIRVMKNVEALGICVARTLAMDAGFSARSLMA
jgi:hypothetical protein